jgi:hypothetical protein
MKCNDVDSVKPLDEIFNEKIGEFESGRDRECDKELDALIWGLGDFENDAPPHEAGEFEEGPPIEEELVEGKMVAGGNGRTSFRGGGRADEAFSASVKQASARSLSPEMSRKRKKGRDPWDADAFNIRK